MSEEYILAVVIPIRIIVTLQVNKRNKKRILEIATEKYLEFKKAIIETENMRSLFQQVLLPTGNYVKGNPHIINVRVYKRR